jgi:hypothetical protein
VARTGALDETPIPEEITARERALAAAIQQARADARPGDIFVPGVVELLRRLVAEDFERRDPLERQAMLDELPAFTPVPNQVYPPEFPLNTFPPALLKQLPELPPELEYRFAGRDLLIRDVAANLIVDVARDVVPAARATLEEP